MPEPTKDEKPRWGTALEYLYQQTFQDFQERAPDLLHQPAGTVAWCTEFDLCAVPYLPQTTQGWADLVAENAWVLHTHYFDSDVPESYPDAIAVLKAVVLNALSDRMVNEVDERLPAVAADLDTEPLRAQ